MPHIHITKISHDDALAAVVMRTKAALMIASVSFFAFSAALALTTIQAREAYYAAQAKV